MLSVVFRGFISVNTFTVNNAFMKRNLTTEEVSAIGRFSNIEIPGEN